MLDRFYLPICKSRQWHRVTGLLNSIYSYGDSAGIAPDFPFNDDRTSTEFGAKIYILGHCP
jgi:hypothetical protein